MFETPYRLCWGGPLNDFLIDVGSFTLKKIDCPAEVVDAILNGTFNASESTTTGQCEIGADEHGSTLLIKAVQVGNFDSVTQAIAMGADPEGKDDEGKTALWHAVNSLNLDAVEEKK